MYTHVRTMTYMHTHTESQYRYAHTHTHVSIVLEQRHLYPNKAVCQITIAYLELQTLEPIQISS